MTTKDPMVIGRDDQIVVRLKRPTPADVGDLREVGGPLAGYLEAHHLGNRRLIRSVSPEQLAEWEAEAHGNPFAPRFSLTAYWLIDASDRDEPIPKLVTGLRRLAGVAEVYRQPQYRAAVTVPPDDPVYAAGTQGHLRAQPNGIDAEWAWALQPSRDGTGANFIDIEMGWQPGHEDLAPLPPLVGGTNQTFTSFAAHGLGVLGIVNALTNNAKGIAGVAPGATATHIASAYYGGTVIPADALAAAMAVSAVGDVFLLEIQTVGQHPVEEVSADMTAIMLAVSRGFVVIEAAGDQGVALASPAIDSGATMVAGAAITAASTSTVTVWEPTASNWGARVDAFAVGHDVYTLGGISPDPSVPQFASNRYSNGFNASSAAAAIVAGAALIVQGAYRNSTLGALTSTQLRTLLKANGTPANQAAKPIGFMPDLRKLLPDIYIRDTVADDGTIPSAGAANVSPDVIVTTTAAANPQATYGAGSANENLDTLGGLVVSGQTNYVYVRMKNRGTATAAGCRATVYWSEPSTLVTPSSWTSVGTTAPVDVDHNLTVTQPLTWNTVPATGHYCFVAIISHPLDPAPAAPTGSWADFVDFVTRHNNVAWRNFDVVDLSGGGIKLAPFFIKGAPDSKRTFDLEIVQVLGGDVEIELEIPLALVRAFSAGELPEPTIDKGHRVARYRLPREPSVAIPKVVLPARAAYPCRFGFRGEAVVGEGEPVPTVAIRQLFREVEVGRLTRGYRSND
jgi:serine protease